MSAGVLQGYFAPSACHKVKKKKNYAGLVEQLVEQLLQSQPA
jgi:hypothetical protein